MSGSGNRVLFNNLLVTAKVLILLFFVAFGLGFFSPGNFTPLAPEGSIGVLSGAALIFFAYTGFARVTLMAEEVKDPKRNIPRSIYLSLGISTVIYLLVSIVAIGLAQCPGACRIRFSPCRCDRYDRESRAVLVIALGAMIATASVLLTTILGISRIVFSMARGGTFPPCSAGSTPTSAHPIMPSRSPAPV